MSQFVASRVGGDAKKYAIFFDGKLVGRSRLEHGDPPMGIVSGIFYPEANYENVKHLISIKSQNQHSKILFTVRHFLKPAEFASEGAVLDRDLLSQADLEVVLHAVDQVTYNEWFSEHVTEYKDRFK
jgi:hypothetical protein